MPTSEEATSRFSLVAMFTRFLFSFHPSSLPLMARLSYARELRSWSLLHMMVGGLQTGTIAVFVKKTFAGVEDISDEQLNLAVGVVAASKAIGHLTSFFWANLSRGQPKVQFIVWLQLSTAVFIASMAFAPRSATGLWLTVGLCTASWMIWSGFITLRTGIWRANYRVSLRPRITGKLSTIEALVLAGTGALIGFCLDWNSNIYRVYFPLLAIAGVAGALLYRRIPYRQEQQHLSVERHSKIHSPPINPLSIVRILKEDRAYRGYMICMFLMGFGNLMLSPLLAIVLTSQFQAGYGTSIAIASVIPLVCMTFAIPFWGRRLERMHVIEFRAVHVWSFVAVSALTVLGVVFDQIALLYLAAVGQGIGWGGGILAWNLGHQHFAPRERDAEYMGVHITLTGIRGVLGPLLGVQIFNSLSGAGWNAGAFIICFVMNVIGAIGFGMLSRSIKRDPPHGFDEHRGTIAKSLRQTQTANP